MVVAEIVLSIIRLYKNISEGTYKKTAIRNDVCQTHITHFVKQADRGCAAGAFFCWGGRGRLGKKVCNALRATDFREERNPLQADSIVS